MWHRDPDDQNVKLFHYNNRSPHTHVLKLQAHFLDKIQLQDTQSVKRLTTDWRVWFLTGQTSTSAVNIQTHTDKLMHFYSQCKNNAIDRTI
jgi:hypothetical protein